MLSNVYHGAECRMGSIIAFPQTMRRATSGVFQTHRAEPLARSGPNPFGEGYSINSILPRCVKNYTRMIEAGRPNACRASPKNSLTGTIAGLPLPMLVCRPTERAASPIADVPVPDKTAPAGLQCDPTEGGLPYPRAGGYTLPGKDPVPETSPTKSGG